MNKEQFDKENVFGQGVSNDAYAHVLLPNFYSKMLEIDESIPQKMPFINNEVLTNLEERRKHLVPGVKEIISYVNINPEDYVDKAESYKLCKDANEELEVFICFQHLGVLF